MNSKRRRDEARKRAKAKPQPIDRRTAIHNAIRAGERAAKAGSNPDVPDIYGKDQGLIVAWANGYYDEKRRIVSDQ